jgi:hypothetical protein
VRAQRTSRKHTRSKRTKKASRVGISDGTLVSPAAALTSPTALTSTPVLAPEVSVAPAATSAAAQMPPRASGTTGAGMVVMAVVGVLVVAALALARHPSPRVVSPAVNTQPEALVQPVRAAAAVPPEALPAPLAALVQVAAVARAQAPRVVVEKPKQTPVVRTASSLADSVPSPPPTVAAPSGPEESPSKTVALERATSGSAAASTATPDAVSQVPVTITGCLETTVDEDRFRLTDTEGVDAPKARSWRSGFLRKHSAPVELLDLSEPLGLRKYVGHRVVATGLLTSRELRVRSLQSAGASCH